MAERIKGKFTGADASGNTCEFIIFEKTDGSIDMATRRQITQTYIQTSEGLIVKAQADESYLVLDTGTTFKIVK